jgi:phosphate uptake regulator
MNFFLYTVEQRKVILFGKSAFCMTLPHSWVQKNKLQKGDMLSVQETLRNSLELMPSSTTPVGTSSLTIDIAGKSTDEIVQLLLATYLNGYTVVTLQGSNNGKVAYLREHIREFIAAEIMEVTSKKIVVHVFWDIETINLITILKRIGHIIRSIFEESIDLLEMKTRVNDITEKGYEVQRQVLLAKRAITYALNNSATAQKFNLSSLELYYISYIIHFSGRIAEYLLLISEIIQTAILAKEMNVSAKKDLKKLLERTFTYYDKVLDTYNKKDQQQKFVISEYQGFEDAINAFRIKNMHAWRPVAAEYIMLLIRTIKEMEFIMINLENSPKFA